MEEQKFNLMKIAGKLKKYLDEDRLWHTLGVMQMSASLAIRYDYPMERAQLAAWRRPWPCQNRGKSHCTGSRRQRPYGFFVCLVLQIQFCID